MSPVITAIAIIVVTYGLGTACAWRLGNAILEKYGKRYDKDLQKLLQSLGSHQSQDGNNNDN